MHKKTHAFYVKKGVLTITHKNAAGFVSCITGVQSSIKGAAIQLN